MAKTFTATFAQAPKTFNCITNAACASITGDTPTNTVELVPASVEGQLITAIWALPRATVTATNLVLFKSEDSGATKILLDSALMSGATVNTTTAIAKTTFTQYSETTPLRLSAGESLYVGAMVEWTSGISWTAVGADFLDD